MQDLIWSMGAIILASGCGQVAPDNVQNFEVAGESIVGVTSGAVFTQTNEALGNNVQAFNRSSTGELTAAGLYATGGSGSGNGLGSQGSLTLTRNNKYLLVVNAGTNDISSFKVSGSELSLRDREPSLGTRPISITEANGVVYVLNSTNIAGFRIDDEGGLSPIAGANLPLSAASVGPAQIQFTSNGRRLVVAEKSTNVLDTYGVAQNGVAQGPQTFPSQGTTPFGFDITRRGIVVISEAATGSTSSYALMDNNALRNVTPALASGERAPCWLTISGDDQYAFVANAQSNSISTYSIANKGDLSLVDPRAAVLRDLGRPLDLGFDADSQHLFVLDAANHRVEGFTLTDGAILEPTALAGTLPSTATGLAVY